MNFTRAKFRVLCARGVLVLASITFVQSLALPAYAEDQKELSRARAQFQQATELEQAGNWAAALRLFREVGQVRMTPQVRYHIALCEENLGKLVAALGGFELALADADSVGPGFRQEVETSINELRARIPKLVIQRGSGAEAASIELDGISLGASSIGIEVPIDPGPHTIAARAPGYRPFSQTVTLHEEEKKTIALSLEPLPASEAPVTSSEASDQTDRGVPAQPPSRVLPYTLGAVGVAGVLGAGAFFFLRQQALSDLDELCPDRNCEALIGTPQFQEAEDKQTELDTWHVLTLASAGVGVACLGTAAVLLLTEDSSNESSGQTALQLVPQPRVDGGSLSVFGRF